MNKQNQNLSTDELEKRVEKKYKKRDKKKKPKMKISGKGVKDLQKIIAKK